MIFSLLLLVDIALIIAAFIVFNIKVAAGVLLALAVIMFIGSRFNAFRQTSIMVSSLLIIVAIVAGFKYEGFKGFMAMQAGMASARQTVSAMKANIQDWQPQLDAVGSLRAAKGVDISNELAGIVEKINFTSGDDVKEGDLLLSLRSEDDQAKLASLQAAAKLAEINYSRDKKQFEVKAVSQASVDADAAQLASSRAQAAEQKAVVDKKFIHAPFSGHLGIRNVDVGQYLTPGNAIVTLQQLDPIYLDFYLPQQSLALVKNGQKVIITCDAFPDRTFEGKVSAINPKVDTATRNVQVRAEIPNADRSLLPGMYAKARIDAGESAKFITLPQTAITYNPYGNTVYLIEDKGKDENGKPKLTVQQSFVTLGETRGDQVQVTKGVKEGDMVVTAGQLKLQNGSLITVDNSITPKNDANPQPKDQ